MEFEFFLLHCVPLRTSARDPSDLRQSACIEVFAFPEITFVENDLMAFQKLTKLFLPERVQGRKRFGCGYATSGAMQARLTIGIVELSLQF